jgi:hypothetical protein
MQKAISINAFINDETDRSRAGEQEHYGVYPGDVIWQKEKSAWRKIFAPARGDAIYESRESQAEKAERAFGRGDIRH